MKRCTIISNGKTITIQSDGMEDLCFLIKNTPDELKSLVIYATTPRLVPINENGLQIFESFITLKNLIS